MPLLGTFGSNSANGFKPSTGGGYVGDGSSRGGFGGSAFSESSGWVTSSNSSGSTAGSLRIILN
jgi:hypothetical protein